MLIAANGDYAGLLSGGCLEGDLRERAQAVIASGKAQLVTYDTRGGDDLIWGLGLGCEGAMHILLFRAGPERDWQPLGHLAQSLATYTPTAVALIVESASPERPVGTVILPEGATPEVMTALQEASHTGRAGWITTADAKLFGLPLSLPPRVLVLGAGPDALPVVELAARQNWKVTVVDHRPAYVQADHFPGAERVVLSRPDELLTAIDFAHFSAAVVMSHHLPSDLAYLRSLAHTRIPYIGLLGPAQRREKLLSDLGGAEAGSLRPRLHAPVGLPLGGRTPESIALAIVAEIHAFVHLGEAATARGAQAAVAS